MKITNLIASGCSFTHDGIGGVPPTSKSIGGSSFRDYDEVKGAECKSWASFLSKFLEVDSFVNFASSGHGLVLTCNTIIDALNKYNYNQNNTLVIFNITSFDRLDVKINWNSNDISDYIPWNSDLLDYTFAKIRGPIWKQEFNQQDIKTLAKTSETALQTLFDYLEQNKFKFVFTMMENYLGNQLIQKHKHHLVSLDPGKGMYEFCKAKQLLAEDNFHPSIEGHKQIANQVYNFIKKCPVA